MITQKSYKPYFINKFRMLPSDLTGSLDDFFFEGDLFCGGSRYVHITKQDFENAKLR